AGIHDVSPRLSWRWKVPGARAALAQASKRSVGPVPPPAATGRTGGSRRGPVLADATPAVVLDEPCGPVVVRDDRVHVVALGAYPGDVECHVLFQGSVREETAGLVRRY